MPLPTTPEILDQDRKDLCFRGNQAYHYLETLAPVGRWVGDIDLEDASRATSLSEQSILTELRAMARRGSIQLEYVSGLRKGDAPILLTARILNPTQGATA